MIDRKEDRFRYSHGDNITLPMRDFLAHATDAGNEKKRGVRRCMTYTPEYGTDFDTRGKQKIRVWSIKLSK